MNTPVTTPLWAPKPTWHFSVLAEMPESLVNKYGGPLQAAADVHQQLGTVTNAFNAPAVFAGNFSFDLAAFTTFADTAAPESQVLNAHPGYDFAIVYEETAAPHGGWYGDHQAILHAWYRSPGVFSAIATQGLIHEFGHSRRAVDLYAESAWNNPIASGQIYLAPASIMTDPYADAGIWDQYTVNVVDRSAGAVYSGAPIVDAAFPPRFVINAVDSKGALLPNVQIDIFPVEWFNNTVASTPSQSSLSASGSWTLPGNPFAPGTPNKPWNLASPNFLVRASWKGLFGPQPPRSTAFAWLPLTTVSSAAFASPTDAFVLTIPIAI
jgi:hypothetical protein